MQKYIKIILFWAIVISMSSALSAQTLSPPTNNENVHFGIGLGGVVTTTFPFGGDYTFKGAKTFIGFIGNGFFQYDFGRHKKWFFHGEINASFREMRAASERASASDTNYLSLKRKHTVISVPLGIGYRFNPSNDELFSMSVSLLAALDLPCYPRTADITLGVDDASQNVNSVLCSGILDVNFKYDFISLSLRYGFDAMPVINVKNINGFGVQKFYTGNFTFQLNFHIF
jgi:hypothetical protein